MNWLSWVLLIGLIGFVLLMLMALLDPETWRAEKRKFQEQARDIEMQNQGLDHNEAGHPACPKCGGTQFKLRRTPGRRAGIGTATVLAGGVGALAAAGKQKVQCVTCGLFYNTL